MIKNGALEGVVARRPTFNVKDPFTFVLVTVDKENWNDEYCPYAKLLVPEMFESVEQDLNSLDPSEVEVRVTFDAQYGFVSLYTRKYPIGNGFLNAVGDCCTGYVFSDFKRLGNKGGRVSAWPTRR